ncbi:lasso peptide biosynthesis B2 protein [Caulobacter sp. CCH5-E12]|uniref:lasso peptide biosynthesis B2 protein n=1 Tax=Caulobacter sp. CCH5-E12 TaxID=1768770 RepID=UPI000782F3D6|nr:lasso peptide biosynthesis B2 protein [Caulobacter sp. CCH5-E12]
MAYRLRSGLSFCRSEGRIIFLDLEADRYFELGSPLAAALDQLIGEQAPDAALMLAGQGLVVEVPAEATPISPFAWPSPEDSGLERATVAKPGAADVFLAGLALAASAIRLRRCALKATLDRLSRRRTRLTANPHGAKISRLADRFLSARRLLPLEPICLRDSLALLEFLAMHGCAADLVIGVQAAPFSAHCWVQSGDCALNETLHQARRHTPILAV